MKFTLYTQSFPNLAELVMRRFEGATITQGKGIWKGGQEDCAVITILGPEKIETARALANDIKVANKQDAVYFTIERLESNELV